MKQDLHLLIQNLFPIFFTKKTDLCEIRYARY
jgi:hypothetical protein